MNGESNQFLVDKIGKQKAVSGDASDHDPNFFKPYDRYAAAALTGILSNYITMEKINIDNKNDLKEVMETVSMLSFKFAQYMMHNRKNNL